MYDADALLDELDDVVTSHSEDDEEGRDPTRTDLDKSQLIPVQDPTRGPLWPVPPPIDDTRPPVVASPAA